MGLLIAIPSSASEPEILIVKNEISFSDSETTENYVSKNYHWRSENDPTQVSILTHGNYFSGVLESNGMTTPIVSDYVTGAVVETEHLGDGRWRI
ncbi:hypothetical protein A1QO_04115 [Vibrio genomosp. F10 str. ZF-129]|uniref:Uncharacterized protein n=2 Tax=Vibrio genomosp. F10 TaxID=723171 RepID=A0A1E5BJR5_9VIBR|nr:hypothetical protein A1QO_04115 [Vibrio genomosp. F10 str. ZF-129]